MSEQTKTLLCNLCAEDNTNVIRIEMSKHALNIAMKFITEMAKKVTMTADENTAYFYLLPSVV